MKYLIITITIIFTLSASTVKAADSFTSNNVRGVLGKYEPLLDPDVGEITTNNVGGVLGKYQVLLDPNASGAVAVTPNFGTVIIFEE